MAVVFPDYFAIKERIRDILKKDTTNLFPSSNATDKSLFRKIEAGAPDENTITQGPYPRMWITNDDIFDTITEAGSSQTVSSKVDPKAVKHRMRFLIIFVADGKNGPKVEETVDDFTFKICNKLLEDKKLSDPDSAGSDKKADDLRIETIATLRRELVGTNVQGRVIRFVVEKITADA